VKFEREGKKPIGDVTEKQLRHQLSLKRGGDNTFAILEAMDGSYVQMIGGGVACCLEWRDLNSRRHYRAYLKNPRVPWKEPNQLGSITLEPHEFLNIGDVTEVFSSFLLSRPFPSEILWRDITNDLAEYGIRKP
jgi:hypothetical protein